MWPHKSHWRQWVKRIANDDIQNQSDLYFSRLFTLASKLYCCGMMAVRWAYLNNYFRSYKLPIPVISVGNLTWGGTGKTPMVEYLANSLVSKSTTPLILSRGYGNDECLQMQAHCPQAILGIGPDRVKSFQNCFFGEKNSKIKVALLDDGLQHWRIKRDLEIVMINSLNPFGNFNLLPRGTLREPLSSLNRADIIVLHHSNLVSKKQLSCLYEDIRLVLTKPTTTVIAESQLRIKGFYPLDQFPFQKFYSVHQICGKPIFGFSGVGNPESFHLILKKLEPKFLDFVEFTDHHQYTLDDIESLKKRFESFVEPPLVITTEKDYYRSPLLLQQLSKDCQLLIMACELEVKLQSKKVHDVIQSKMNTFS